MALAEGRIWGRRTAPSARHPEARSGPKDLTAALSAAEPA